MYECGGEALVVELADTSALGADGRNPMRVQILPRASNPKNRICGFLIEANKCPPNKGGDIQGGPKQPFTARLVLGIEDVTMLFGSLSFGGPKRVVKSRLLFLWQDYCQYPIF